MCVCVCVGGGWRFGIANFFKFRGEEAIKSIVGGEGNNEFKVCESISNKVSLVSCKQT